MKEDIKMQYEFNWDRTQEESTKMIIDMNKITSQFFLDKKILAGKRSKDCEVTPSRNNNHCVLMLNELRLFDENQSIDSGLVQLKTEMVSADNLSAIQACFGVFRHEKSAQYFLQCLQKHHQLCPVYLGLETTNYACKAHARNQCRGVCVGKETPQFHYYRLLAALVKYRIPNWPSQQPIVWEQTHSTSRKKEFHVFDQWCYLGMADSVENVDILLKHPKKYQFDLDCFRILKNHFFKL